MTKKKASSRVQRTEKLSISLDRADLAVLRRHARIRHGGNLSAVIAEVARRLVEEEGRLALVAWLGDADRPTPAEREAILAEWTAPITRKRRRSAA
jgi:hypothetical protein